jgi:predicted PurR-regulated permease PerM
MLPHHGSFLAAVDVIFVAPAICKGFLAMESTTTVHAWQRAVVALSATVITAIVVGALHWAQMVFIPLGMAIFLAFLLNPPVRAMQRRGLGRMPSVTIAVFVVACLLTTVGWLLARQTTDLIADLPKYSTTIREKIESLRVLGSGTRQMLEDISSDLKNNSPRKSDNPEQSSKKETTPDAESPVPVVLRPEIPAWLEHLPGYLGSMVGALGGLVLVLVLVFFMLLRREDLRDRFLRLMGRGRMPLTTKAVDDAGQRISRFLIMQAVVNAGVGMALALGLLAFGVDGAFTWGLLAAVLRYVPYVGIWIAALLLLTLCIAIFPSWMPLLFIFGLFLIIELITANLLEPRLYGQSIGVSEIAFLVAALFWGFLWGPIGLVLSSPLTVCLLVMGKHVRQLKFLEVVLGDEPVLNPQVSYYQRLIARDQDEATVLALTHANDRQESIYDELLLPALRWAKHDRAQGEITELDEQFIVEATREIMDEWWTDWPSSAATASDDAPDQEADCSRIKVLAIPARDAADRLALEMLEQLLGSRKWHYEITPVGNLPAELVTRVAENRPDMVCISTLPPGGLARTRYLCKMLRRHFPDLKIAIGLWGLETEHQIQQQELKGAGADFVASTVLEIRNQLQTQLNILAREEPVAAR